MKLYNTKDNPAFIDRIVKYCQDRSSWEYGYDAVWYEDLANDPNSTTIYFVYDEENDKIMSILTHYPRFKQMIWKIGANESLVVEVLKTIYPDGFFATGNSYYLEKADMHAIECRASYDEHVSYPAIANAGIWTNNPNMTTVIRDWLESKYLTIQDDWKNKIAYKWITEDEFVETFYDKDLIDWPYHRTGSGHYAYVGFHYLNWDHSGADTQYLVAMVNGIPIGCICVQTFERYGYHAISYIDVAFPYKNNGIAKKMIHKLAQRIPDDLPLLLSMESEEGQKCHIHECFKREKWPKGAFTQEEWDEMWRKKTKQNAG